ncbi:hypothetical protein DXG03_001599 [Asterophora parasitica]|uniref:Uncharacterized protein n=1 Tax=Asterophora parasitica TaxID=117018 RepID=A0A9P7G4S1_9AGAR|nr:hypothetical protein DXG03_001599 [Asterophora parasitica]
MSSRISIARPQPNSFSSDPHGLSNSRASSGYRAANPDDPIEKLKVFSQQVEDNVEIYSQPLKPHLPAIGRFLIVVTFLEDALRILTQWGDQIWYLQQHRKFPWGLSHLFLIINVVVSPASSAYSPASQRKPSQTMLSGSGAVILKRYTEYAVAGLLAVVVIQGFGYGLIFVLNFFLRNLSVIGGLFMVFSDSMVSRKALFAGIPSISETDRKK